MTEFFHMGGYAAYVWPSFAITAIIMLRETLVARSRMKQALQKSRDFHESNPPEED